jgi:MFS family permease
VNHLLRALASRNYRLFFTGQAISLVGMWMQMTAQSWLMYRLTGSAFAVGLLAAAQTAPGLLIGPFAGALADRHDRRKLLVATSALSIAPALATALLTLADRIDPAALAALALVAGVIRSAEMPTRQALVPEIVEREHLLNAISLNSALFNAARVVGPAIAGAVIAASNEGWCFLVNAVSYLAPVSALLALRLPRVAPRARSGESMLSEVLEGVRYVRADRFLLALMGGLALASLSGMPYTVLLPSFAREALGGGPQTYSALTSAVGVGAIVSALTLASRRDLLGLERIPAIGGAVFGAGLVGLSQAGSLAVALPLMALVGVGFMTQMTSTNTLLQLAVPDRLRGRVMALHSALFLGIVPLGGIVAGRAADRVGEANVLAAGGALLFVGALWFGVELGRRSRPLPEAASGYEPDATPEA